MDAAKNAADLLYAIGMSPKYKGYAYLQYIFSRTIVDRELIYGISVGLYPLVMEHFKIGRSCVERNIRFAIRRTWENDRDNRMRKLFYDYGVEWTPTNHEFISIITESAYNNRIPDPIQTKMW